LSPSNTDPSFEQLLEYVRDTRAFDYKGYKRPSLMRRFEKRVQAVGAESWDEYRAYLNEHPDEFNELFDTILINVTGFFRDPETWDFLRDDVIPQLLERKGKRAPIRVWSAGCASGEEAYSVAILLTEALGEDQFKERVKVFATDVDEPALTQARHAAYAQKQLAEIPDELREKYFTGLNHLLSFRNDIRRCVIFGRNDLMQDPPISRVDLLLSRNTLMYFNAPAQERILANFYFALVRSGFLVLGKAESLQRRGDLFVPYDLKRRVFVRNTAPETEPRANRLRIVDEEGEEPLTIPIEPAFEQAPLSQLVVDSGGRIAAINHHARAMFGLKSADVGRPLQDLEVSYRPVELRSIIERVRDERRPLTTKEVEWHLADGDLRYLDVQVSPLTSMTGEFIAVSVTFTDVTRYRSLHEDLERARRDLETAYEELQSTVEELETTNEELQSTNKELETTNEELQSTNEELETMNEELQSANEELETMNDELRDRTDAAMNASTFLSSILGSIRQGVIVVDREFRVRAWSDTAADLWGIRADEIQDQNFLNLDIGLPVGELREPMRHVLSGEDADTVELDAYNRRGQPIRCRVSFAQINSHRDGAVEGVILVVAAERQEMTT
jgi:two-component system, chemotaxis family, CheB/CheR fusion protein